MDGNIDKVREALETLCEALELALARLGVCGQGDGADHKAEADSIGGTNALTMGRAALSALSAIDPDVKRKEAIDAFRMDELDAVMVSVDKWLPDNYPTGINPATRAAAAREIALKAIEKFDPEAIRRAQRMKSLLQSISSWFACWGIATKDDLGQSVEEFDREITAILSAEPAQDEGKPDAFASAIVKELRVNWAFDTEDALSVLNGAKRRL